MGLFTQELNRLFGKKRNDRTIQEQHAELLKGTTQNDNNDYKMVINKGQDDEMVICLYRTNLIKLTLIYLSFVLSLGIVRLIFHWIPHWYVRATCNPCGVNAAHTVLIEEKFKGKHSIYHVKELKILTSESIKQYLLNNNDNNIDKSDNMPKLSVHYDNGIFQMVDYLFMFNCKKVTYIWNNEKNEFVKLNGLDQNIDCNQLHKMNGLTINEQLIRRLIYGPNKILVKELSILAILFLEVLNPFYIFQIASFILWFLDNYYYYATAIFIMSVFGITMTVRQTRKNQRNLKSTVHSSDICTIMRKKQKINLNNHYTNNNDKDDNNDDDVDDDDDNDVDYYTECISTDLLVPGDVLIIPSHGCIMHCDAILLTGTCIVNESMLTGESVPVTKTSLPNLNNLIYNEKEHSRHTLFCGTKIIQTRYFNNEKVLAVVIRTGFQTAKGSLVRSILYPPPVDYRFETDSYRFVMLLAVLAGIGFIYTIITKTMRGVSANNLIIDALDLITIIVPPALPAAMSVGRLYAQIQLKSKDIFCISPRSINVSGSIDCVCFDKTGTLTEDGLDLLSVVPIYDKNFHTPIKHIDQLPQNNKLFCGLVSCHSLTIIDKQIVGDPLDLKMFESTKWLIEEYDVADNNKFDMIFPTVLKPPKKTNLNSITNKDGGDNNLNVGDIGDDDDDDDEFNNGLQIGIIREFPFSSSSQRMGVIIRKLNGKSFEYYCKGSPEMLLNFVNPDTVPSDFHDVLENYTQDGYRVIAIAHKELKKMSYAKIHKIQREAIEIDLTLLGLIVLENRLKADTHPCIQVLNEANIRVIMVTGDNILTALSVAKDCDIITNGQSVITINNDNNNPPQLYFTLANTTNKKSPIINNTSSIITTTMTDTASILSMETIETQTHTIIDMKTNENFIKNNNNNNNDYNNYRFAITGKIWSIIKDYYPDLLARVVTRGTIYARMSPEQKQQLVQELQNLGHCVAMCGDGANDCGALKAAHTGISLSEAESSVASPFTSKNPNITCVLDIIKEGRAALVTSFGIFKYMAAYSLCQFVSVLILYSIDSNLTDMEFLYIDLFIISIFAFFFGRTKTYRGKLVKETPLSSLISLSPILSLLLQMLLVISVQISAYFHLQSQPWFIPFVHKDIDDDEEVACVENYTIFTVSSFQYIILAIVFSKGAPYRKSIFTNYGLIIAAILTTLFSIYLTLEPAQFLIDYFELILPEDFNFRLILLIYVLVNFVLSIFIEQIIIDYFVFKKYQLEAMGKKLKYRQIEHEINLDTKWPILTSDYKSAASPQTPYPPTINKTEIYIEQITTNNDNNDVLNKLCRVVEDPPFSSLPSINDNDDDDDDDDDTFQSLPPTTSLQHDSSSSFNNIADLPYDQCYNSLPCTQITNSNKSSNLSSFNLINRPNLNLDNNNKDFEMNCLKESSNIR